MVITKCKTQRFSKIIFFNQSCVALLVGVLDILSGALSSIIASIFILLRHWYSSIGEGGGGSCTGTESMYAKSKWKFFSSLIQKLTRNKVSSVVREVRANVHKIKALAFRVSFFGVQRRSGF